jgi:hypothetical protein
MFSVGSGVAYCYVAVTTLSELEKWVGSTYFGKASEAKRFHDWQSEKAAIKKLLDEANPKPPAPQ